MTNHFMQQYNFGHEAPMAPLADSTLIEQTEEVEIPARQTGLYRDNPNPEYLGAMQMVVTDTDKYVEAIPAIDGSSDEGGEGGQESGGTESGSTEPVEEVSTSYEIISDKESWETSFASGVLKAYYEKYPSEDIWNSKEGRACNFNDKIYTAKVYTDPAGEGEYEEKQFAAFWLSDEVQKITEIGGDENVYYIPMFYDVPNQIYEMFCNAPGGYAAKAADLADSSSHYIKVESMSFGGEGVGPAYEGWIANGAQTPWICPNFMNEDPAAKIIFRYEGLDDVTPWGDTLFGNGEGHKAWGTASAPVELGINDFDESKFQMILLKNA